jgi:hypothetical protein
MSLFGQIEITLIASAGNTGHYRELIETNLNDDWLKGWYKIREVATNKLSPDSPKWIIIAPDSLNGGLVSWVIDVAKYVRSAVSDNLRPVIVINNLSWGDDDIGIPKDLYDVLALKKWRALSYAIKKLTDPI